jgi:hypothetical protein
MDHGYPAPRRRAAAGAPPSLPTVVVQNTVALAATTDAAQQRVPSGSTRILVTADADTGLRLTTTDRLGQDTRVYYKFRGGVIDVADPNAELLTVRNMGPNAAEVSLAVFYPGAPVVEPAWRPAQGA